MPKIGEKSVAVTVAIRVRPINVYQTLAGLSEKSATPAANIPTITVRSSQKNTIIIGDPTNPTKTHSFTFDHVFNSMTPESTMSGGDQTTIFKEVGMGLLQHTLQGYNTCLFAYGQTGSGKTYTISGFEDEDIEVLNEEERQGLLPRICEALSNEILSIQTETRIFRVEMCYYEIYNEKVRCLLDPDPNVTYRVREHPVTGPFVVDLKTVEVNSTEEMLRYIRRAQKNRQTASTQMNATSSRSHSVCCVTVASTAFDPETGEVCETISKMNIVDLAGSERSTAAGTSGQRLTEGSNINKSLLSLGNVIEALATSSTSGDSALDNAPKFVPYRESTLTWLLKEALGGNSRTVMLACVSPNIRNYEESVNTLKYADRAKQIKNLAAINVDSRKQLVFDLKAEIQMLREQLEKAKIALENGVLGTNTDAITLSRQCPFLLQVTPTPTLHDAIVYYLPSRLTVLTKEVPSMAKIDHATKEKTFILLEGRGGVCTNHCTIENNEMRLVISEVADKVLLDGRRVQMADLPEDLESGLDLEVGAYTFKVVNPVVFDSPNESRELGITRRQERNMVEHRQEKSSLLLDRLGTIMQPFQIGPEKEVIKRKGRAGEKMLARTKDSEIVIFEWDPDSKAWTLVNDVDESIVEEVITNLAELNSTSAIVQAILLNSTDLDGSKALNFGWEHDATTAPPPNSPTVQLVYSHQFEGCVLGIEWDAKEKGWYRSSAAAAESCAIKEIERRRALQHNAAIANIQSAMNDLETVQKRSVEAQDRFSSDMQLLNEAIRHAQAGMQRTNQDIVAVEQRTMEANAAHKAQVLALKNQFAERMEDAESEMRAAQQRYSQLSETIESKEIDIETKMAGLKLAEDARDAAVEQVRSVKTSIATLQREISKAVAEEQALRKDIEKKGSESEQHKKQKEILDQEACERITDDQCREEVMSLTQQINALTEQKGQLLRNLEQLQTHCNSYHKKTEESGIRNEALEADAAELRERINHDEGELTTTLAERKRDLQAEIEKINSSISDARRLHTLQTSELTNLVELARAEERRVLTAKMQIQEEQHSRTVGMSKAAQTATIRALQKERAQARELMQTTMTERDAAKRRLKELEHLIEQRDKVLTTLRDEHAGWHNKLQVCKADSEKRKVAFDRLTAAEAKLKATNQKVAETEKAIRSSKKEEEELRAEAKEKKEAVQKLRSELEANIQKLKAMEKEAKQLRTEAQDTKRETQALLLRSDDLRETVGADKSSSLNLPTSGGRGLTPRGLTTPNYMRGTQSSQGKLDEEGNGVPNVGLGERRASTVSLLGRGGNTTTTTTTGVPGGNKSAGGQTPRSGK